MSASPCLRASAHLDGTVKDRSYFPASGPSVKPQTSGRGVQEFDDGDAKFFQGNRFVFSRTILAQSSSVPSAPRVWSAVGLLFGCVRGSRSARKPPSGERLEGIIYVAAEAATHKANARFENGKVPAVSCRFSSVARCGATWQFEHPPLQTKGWGTLRVIRTMWVGGQVELLAHAGMSAKNRRTVRGSRAIIHVAAEAATHKANARFENGKVPAVSCRFSSVARCGAIGSLNTHPLQIKGVGHPSCDLNYIDRLASGGSRSRGQVGEKPAER